MPLLEIDRLSVHFSPDTPAVDAISFLLEKGETLGIVGESGSGKSVTSLAIMRLLDEERTRINGRIIFNGADLFSLDKKAMQALRGGQIGMIFQEPMTSLNPLISCGNQVLEAIRQHRPSISKKEGRKQVLDLFDEVRLPRPESIFSSYPHQLSGGQKQRVMIAMALSCDPRLLIADEPTTALDVTVQKTILDLLNRLKADREMSMLFISHDLGVVKQVANRAMVMQQGKIVEEGPVETLFTQPRHPYTKGLLASRPDPTLRLQRLPSVQDFLHSEVPVQERLDALRIDPARENDRRKRLQEQSPLQQVTDLCTRFALNAGFFGRPTGFVQAVDEVSFSVFPGETLGLVGESGCGKTTLGRSILRLVEPSSGSIKFDGKEITTLGNREMRGMRRDMQLVFQDPYASLNPRKTIGESIIEPMHVHAVFGTKNQQRERAMHLLEKVNLLPGHFDRYPHEFSGGQRQRVVIARALALQPRFLICDESVAALDVSVQAQVLNLLKDLQDEFKLTYLFISHDLAVVKHLSDRILVMNSGKIVEEGSSGEIYHHPQNAYTRKLIAAIPA
ncbi:MAG: ABC transporter ATP-binding protein [Mucilaginibacter polytrichastri]|nr:ABC transporter ATP-binding protein [Mucilaginibacter polytrichastri]